MIGLKRLNHLPSSAQVLVFSWISVLAVTTPRQSGKVMKAHKTIGPPSVDLAMP